ncbi:MAG TPA: gas vesicle protein GvpG [Gaiellaceae bacterium]|nr:gas vesicle protein GvpG [Gaiellaceae bacterium]
MGIVTGLLTLPLAPVRGVAWIAEQLAAEAERELYGTAETLRRELSELQHERAFGQIDDAEYAERETALLTRLAELRRRESV